MNTPTETDLRQDSVISLNPIYHLRWEEPQQSYVLLYPEGVVKLNETAAAILKRCNGKSSVQKIGKDLETEFKGEGIVDSVYKFLEVSYAKGWIRIES